MNARGYKVDIKISPFDFPAIIGLGESSVQYRTEVPKLINNKVILTITNSYFLTDVNKNKTNEVLSVQSFYEIPTMEIKNREDVYDCFKDAALSLNEVLNQYAIELQFPPLQDISLPAAPMENLKQEIDGVFYILQSQN